jgi:3-deoxy-7-phosphoheptulonate synthase
VIIILKADATEAQRDQLISQIEAAGLQAHLSEGTYRTILGIIGDETLINADQLRATAGVADVLPVLPPYKLASRDAHPQSSIVDVAGVKFGGGHLAFIAGPCAVEEAPRMESIARSIKAAGAHILRGGAYKPRTSPYSFQGMGLEGLKLLRAIGDQFDIPVVSEVTDPRHVEELIQYVDMLQVGARNMQNFVLLTEVGRSKTPVLMKRGMSATLTDLLMCAEYVLAQGNPNVILCERGIKSFDPATRNLFDVAAVPAIQHLSHLPIIVDPSHATGRPELIPACALAGIAAGADGVHIEVHDNPAEAMSDGPQALLPEQYSELADQMRQLAALLNKQVPVPESVS